MELLEELHPEPALLPADPSERARARLLRSTASTRTSVTTTTRSAAATRTISQAKLAELEVGQSLFADIAYVPWVIRCRDMLGVDAPAAPRRLARRARAAAVGRGRGRRRARAVSDIELDELAGRLGDVALVDVRDIAEFDGSGGKPCDPRQGHIPGARHLDVYELMAMTQVRRARAARPRARRGDRRLLPQRLALGDRGAGAPLARLRRTQLRRLVARVVAPRRPAYRALTAASARNARQSFRPSLCHSSSFSSSCAAISAGVRGVVSSSNHVEHVLAADLRVELERPRVLADPERLQHRPLGEQGRARRERRTRRRSR